MKYNVTVRRTEVWDYTYKIEADDEKTAKRIAVFEFNPKNEDDFIEPIQTEWYDELDSKIISVEETK